MEIAVTNIGKSTAPYVGLSPTSDDLKILASYAGFENLESLK